MFCQTGTLSNSGTVVSILNNIRYFRAAERLNADQTLEISAGGDPFEQELGK